MYLTPPICGPPLFALDRHGAIQSDALDKPPYPRVSAKCFYRLWARTDPGGRRHHKRCAIQTDNRHPTQPKDVFEFGGTLELLTTTLFFSKHDIVISEIMWGLDEGSPLDAHDPYTQWIELYNPHVGAHITAHLFLLLPHSRITRTGISSSCQMVCKRACSTLSATYT